MKAGYTHITIVLDRSGSMQAIRADAIGGFNQFLKDQQALPGMATLSLVQFNHEVGFQHEFAPLAEVKALCKHTFIPQGNTALLDAFGLAIYRTGQWLAALSVTDRPERVLVVVLTDGMENASRHYTSAKVAQMIQHQEKTYGWDFLFLAANQDAITTASGMGLAADRAADFHATGHGSREAMGMMSRQVTRVRTKEARRMSVNAEEHNKLTRPARH
jgi:Mg-chelatase subunit ChlD